MNTLIKHCGILIIAAGQSKRLGQPKQLLMYKGKSLINRLIDTVKEAGEFPITLVLGANAQLIQDQLTDKTINIVFNHHWQQGMASSIKVGLEKIINKVDLGNYDSSRERNNQPIIDGIMILVCDQPFINSHQIKALIHLQQETQLPIAACYYAQVLGTPALFHATVFNELLALQGDIGAKKIISNRAEEVAKLHFEKGIIDIDTIEDYKNWIQQEEA